MLQSRNKRAQSFMDNYMLVYIVAHRVIEVQYAQVQDTREKQLVLAPYPEMFSQVNIFLLRE